MCAYDSACGGGVGWGRLARVFVGAPTLTLQPKSDVSDFGQSISGRTQVNLSSAASGGGNAPSVPRGLCINVTGTSLWGWRASYEAERNMSVVGRSVPRLEDPPLVRGRGRFAADVAFPHMLHMRLVRSASAHGR